MLHATRFASLFLALVSLAHLLRVVLRISVTIGGVSVPGWVSLLARIVTGGLAGWLWREGRRGG